MQLDKSVIKGFVNSVLASRFDNAVKTPDFHEEMWEMLTSRYKYVAISAPRGHAKTTGGTVCYGLATLLFRQRKFMLIVSDTESQASMFLGYFKEQLQENNALIELFGVKRDEKGQVRFIKETETDIVVQFEDGHKFRVIAKGAEQKLRGLIWNGSRPDIIICHEKDTEIHTPETGWIKNTDYPDAKTVHAEEAYKITFDDGHTEVVSGDHRFLTESGWKYIWEMSPGENVVESGIEDILKRIQKNVKNLSHFTITKRKLKNVLLSGMRRIVIESLLPASGGMKRIKNVLISKLLSMLDKILPGKLLTVLNAEHTSSRPFLLGFPQNS